MLSPEQASQRAALHASIAALIARLADGQCDSLARDALLLDLADYQARWVVPFTRFVVQRARKERRGVDAVPALPTDAFRFARISSRPHEDDVRTFRSSGTTNDERSQHAFADLSLYDLAARTAARYALFPDRERMDLVILAPTEQALPESSLSYMLARFAEWFGAEVHVVWPIPEQIGALDAALRHAEARGIPVALLGTSFAFVHALDALGAVSYRLPPASRIMQTGGFKGRAREIAPDVMRAMLAERFGLDEAWIAAEYGMTELSSQLYETTLREAALGLPQTARRLWAPGWIRAVPVDPETLAPIPGAEEGLLRIDDAANLDSVSAIQTADVARREADGIVLRGRAEGAVARGCSITADDLLGRHR